MREDINNSKEVIKSLLESGVPRMEVARRFGCKYPTLKARLIKWGLENLKNPNRKGLPHFEGRRPATYYLKLNGPFINSHKLKLVLWRDRLKKKQCECCGIDRWMNMEAPLELEHTNGNHYDNRLENLEILCPNCHALRPTNSEKNKKRS